jgi:elongation factor G
MRGGKGEELSEISAGHIGAAVGLKNTFTGDTLCSGSLPVIFEKIKFPEPVFSVSIEPKTKADQDKLTDALLKLTGEDPTLILRYDQETLQTIISGMGELHLEIIVDRMRREFRVECNVGRPRVSYRETITKSVRQEGRFIRQSGGHGQYGHVWLELEPLGLGQGFVFENRIVGGSIPREYIPAVEKGVREALTNGVLAGYPVVDIKVALVDGSYHTVDSSEIAFKLSAQLAMKHGLSEAKSILLEPIMEIEIVTPKDFLGEVLGDINSRRGRIQQLEDQSQGEVIRALTPLAEMFGYATTLRSLTQGRASHSMEFKYFERVPDSIAAEVLKTAKT